MLKENSAIDKAVSVKYEGTMPNGPYKRTGETHRTIKLIKEKGLRMHSLHENTAASVLLKT